MCSNCMLMSCKYRYYPFIFRQIQYDRPRLFRAGKEMRLISEFYNLFTHLSTQSTMTVNGYTFLIDNCKRKPDGVD